MKFKNYIVYFSLVDNKLFFKFKCYPEEEFEVSINTHLNGAEFLNNIKTQIKQTATNLICKEISSEDGRIRDDNDYPSSQLEKYGCAINITIFEEDIPYIYRMKLFS
jgi:hypothetical protein